MPNALLVEGDIIDNRYQVVKDIGKGGFGYVYLIRDDKGEQKALKCLKQTEHNQIFNKIALETFRSEFSILSALSHPGIAKIYDYGFDESRNTYYFTSEFIDGKSILEAIKGYSYEIVEDLAVQILRALNYLHSRSIYHLDIKPENILVQEKDKKLVAKLIDFGLSGMADSGKTVGTAAYMSPEMIEHHKGDAQSDLYSLGVVLYEMFTGNNPFHVHKDAKATQNRQLTVIPAPPSQIKSDIPAHWDSIIMNLLEKKKEARYVEAASVIQAINLISDKNYEIETKETRLSYLLEKGKLIGRQREFSIFKNLFKMTFSLNAPTSPRLLILEGEVGTGKTRLLSEFKYHCQLNQVSVYTLTQFNLEAPMPPLVVMIDEPEEPSLNQINQLLQRSNKELIFIIWATRGAKAKWNNSAKLTLQNFTEPDLIQYLSTVTKLENPPAKLVKEIQIRTKGNPLFVTELLKTLLNNNIILDDKGQWASTTFEDIKIDFDKIHVPENLSDLLTENYQHLSPDEKKIMEWLAISRLPLFVDDFRLLASIAYPQKAILSLIEKELIERGAPLGAYCIRNPLVREVLLTDVLPENQKRGMHDNLAQLLKNKPNLMEEFLYHQGYGTNDEAAVDSLIQLSDLYLKKEKGDQAILILEEALKRAARLDTDTRITVEMKLAESTIASRHYQKGIEHYKHLKNLFDTNPGLAASLDRKVEFYTNFGVLLTKLERFEEAFRLFEMALKWIESDPKKHVQKIILENWQAYATMRLKSENQTENYSKAEEIFRANLKAWENTLNPEEKLLVKNNRLAYVLILKGSYEEALKQIEKDILFYTQTKNTYLLAQSTYEKGFLHCKRLLSEMNPDSKIQEKLAAVESLEKCHDIAQKINALDQMFRAYNELATLFQNQHNPNDDDEAANYYKRALDLAWKQNDLINAALISLNLGCLYKVQKNYRDAYSYLVYAINTLENNAELTNYYPRSHLFQCYVELANTHQEMGEYAKAERVLSQAESFIETDKDLPDTELLDKRFWIFLAKAKIYHKLPKQEDNCREYYKRAQELAQEKGQDKDTKMDEIKKFQELLNQEQALQDLEASTKKQALPSGVLKQKTFSKIENTETSEDLTTILTINKLINSEHNLDVLLKMILHHALELTKAESGLVLLLDQEGNLSVKSSVNIKLNQELTNISTHVAKRVVETGEMLQIADALADSQFATSESIVSNSLRSILCLPIRSQNKIIGVLYLDNRYRANAFEGINIGLLHAFCDQVGLAIENAKLISDYQALQKQLEDQLEKTTTELSEVKEILKTESPAYLTKYSYNHIISRSKPMQEIFKMLDKITETNLSVYLCGPSGSGKELIARALHYNNLQRAQKRFVTINCGAIPANLIESELFGHKAGSFTGATKDKKGLVEEAQGGTLFLDEVGDLDLNLQVKLLRVLQEGEVQRVGETKPIKVDVRVVCASHKSLENMIKEGTFREDLYFRLCQINITLPPLSDRKEDIPLLADHFINKFKEEHKITDSIKVSPSILKAFLNYNWPGNIRELENLIFVACALREGESLNLSALPPNYRFLGNLKKPKNTSAISAEGAGFTKMTPQQIHIDEKNPFDDNKTWADYEALIIAKCYEASAQKKATAAQMLGISPATLYNKIREHDLDSKDNPLYQDPFVYTPNTSLKDYLPCVFRAALEHAQNRPYTAIKQLGVSQGYFYKVMKNSKK